MSDGTNNNGCSANSKHQSLLEAVRQLRGLPNQAKRQIEVIAVARLTARKANARTHSPKQLRQIAASIKRFGFTVPILVNAQNEILAGHGRVEAAKLLELTEVLALRLNHLSAAEQRAYVIADNRLAELAGWDRDALAIELNSLVELDFDIAVTGFDIGEIELSVASTEDVGDDSTAANRFRAAAKVTCDPAVSQLGDEWMLGPHRLICGEADDNRAYAAVDGAIRRWQAASGGSATLVGTGQSFAAIQKERRQASGSEAGAACAGRA
jgi:hypothetical protein